MKRNLFILFICLIFSIGWCQSNSINYKAVITDSNGNIIADQDVTIQFAILQGLAQTSIYSESHNTNTDTNGMAILNIGEGSVVSGSYNSIEWGATDHFLNVQIDIGEGLIDMGTTEFNAVPYAQFALNSGNAVTKIDDLEDGRSNESGTILFLGQNAGVFDDGGFNYNIGIGDGALFGNSTGKNNVAIGSSTLSKNTANNNTALGYTSLNNNTDGFSNTAVGSQALFKNTIGNFNSAFGFQSLHNSDGYRNSAFGAYALFNNTNTSDNAAFGYNALFNNQDGEVNTAIGNRALYNNVSGGSNIALGYDAGYNVEGNGNVFLGTSAGYGSALRNLIGSVFIGYGAGWNFTESNRLLIQNAFNDDPLIYGEFDTDLVRINGTLDVNNAFRFPLTDGLDGQVLRTNGSGSISWHTLPTSTNLWTELGPNVYRESGNVGIGTSAPTQKLRVNGKIMIGDDSNPPSVGSIRYNTVEGDFEGYNGLEFKSFTDNTSAFAYDTGLSTNSSLRDQFVTSDVLVPITVTGTYFISYSCEVSSLHGNTINLPADRSIIMQLAREVSGSLSSIDLAYYDAHLVQLSTGASAWSWRLRERMSDFMVFRLTAGTNLRLRVQVNDNDVGISPTTTWTIVLPEIYAIKVAD